MNISKFLMIIISIVAFTPANAQDYYYSSGKKIPLKRNPQKVSILTPKGATSNSKVSLNLPNNTILDKSLQSEFFDFDIIENNMTSDNETTNLISSLQNSSNSVSSIILPCYMSNTYNDIILTELINVKLQKTEDITKLQTLADKMNLQILKQDEYMPLWWMLSITTDTNITTLEAANALYETGLFEEAYPNMHESMLNISWDEYVKYQWGLYNTVYDTIDINISSAWNIATGKDVKIAIVDTGVDINHQDLKENIIASCDATTSTNTLVSPNIVYDNHGTHVAGIAAAIRNNGIQFAGVAPDADIMAISVQFKATNTNDNLTFGVNWAWKNGADVINCSWGSELESPKRQEALDSALYRGRRGKGCIIVASSGNEYNDTVSYPGHERHNILSVGAIAQNGILANFSNYGEYLNIVAPGVDIYSTLPDNEVDVFSGTSMAAPFVSGLAALILERNPDLTGQQVRDIIEQNTTKVGDVPYTTVEGRPNGTWNAQYGYGLIDAYRALKATPRKKENY